MKNALFALFIQQTNPEMNIPAAILEFIQPAIVTEDLCLPQEYPTADTFEKFQEGYRYNAVTGASLIGTKPGDFLENWYVIAQNYFSDPFIVDLTEANQRFPVYYAPHGAGKWTLVKVADDISAFAQLLSGLTAVQDDKAAVFTYLEANTDLSIALWKEVYTNFEEKEWE
ncbi:SMI1/KNR4 family protein [Chitinophaga arvensicola]|uniref:SMI1 / KNR4 family (SUKH-1) n=1 Tax=Chitinophaga arvensicola TaxID=29529 RepID=A0A1I0S953_9BACT|nr:SMI1/KNR4 family protein [Chitinophaga arvensicola]SEW52687.1 hypothetical protein SAMN04488122_5029 [Chitinophaga arvensicola]